MLQNVTAQFPFIGSTGYVRGSGELVGIIQRKADGSFLVKRPTGARSEGASLTRTLPAADLVETLEEAMGLTSPSRPNRLRARQLGARKQRRA